MNIQRDDFTAWTPILHSLHLSDLDIQEDQGLFLREKSPREKVPSALDPAKIAQIKKQFDQCVVSCLTPRYELQDLSNQLQSLKRDERKIAFLEKLVHSPLLQEVYSSKEDITRLAQQIQRESVGYQESLRLSADRLKQYIEQAPVKDEDDVVRLRNLEQEFANLNRVGKLQGEVSKSLEKREQALVKRWLASLATQYPGLHHVLRQLSKEDQQFLCQRLDPAKMDAFQADRYKETLPTLCRKLSEIKDPQLRQMLKKNLFLMKGSEAFTMAASGAEQEVKSLLEFVSEDPSEHSVIGHLMEFPAGRSPAEHCGQLLQFVRNVETFPEDLKNSFLQRCHRDPVEILAFINRAGPNASRSLLELGLRISLPLLDLLPEKFALVDEWQALFPPPLPIEFFADKGETGLLTSDPKYWEKCQQQLEKHPVAPDWVRWMSKLLPIEKAHPLSWPDRAALATPGMRNKLAALFAIEKSHPDLFDQIVNLLHLNGSMDDLDSFLYLYDTTSYEQAKALIASIQAYPHLLQSIHLHAYFLQRYRQNPGMLKVIGQLDQKGIPFSPNSVSGELSGVYWGDIPDKIWELDLTLPIRLSQWLGSSQISLYPLLEGACRYCENALVYQLLKTDLNKDAKLLKTITKIAANHGDQIGLACYQLLFPESGALFESELPFLFAKPWTPAFDTMLTAIETQNPIKGSPLMQRLFSIVYAFDPETRMQKLPFAWRETLIRVMDMGLTSPERVQPLCELIQSYPSLDLVQERLKLLERLPVGSSYDWFSVVMDHPHYEYREEYLNRLDIVAGKIPPDMLQAFFRLPYERKVDAMAICLGSPERFIEMMQWDAKLGPPPGRAISWNFDDQIAKKLRTEPRFAEVVKLVGLSNIDRNMMQRWDKTYFDLLRLQPYNRFVRNSQDQEFWSAVSRIDLTRLSHPARFVDHVATVAKLAGIPEIKIILGWMETHDYQIGEKLLDMAKAGYLPEVMALITTHPEMLNMAGSQQAPAIQSTLQKTPKAPSPVTLASPAPAVPLPSIAFDPSVKKTGIFLSETDKERALEVATTTEMAQILVSPAGHIRREAIPLLREKLRNFSEIPSESDLAHYLQTTLAILERDPDFSERLSKIEISPGPASTMVRRMLEIHESEPLTNRHAQVAALSALLSRLRQSSGVGSCFATSWGIITQSDSAWMKAALEDYRNLLGNQALVRKEPKSADGTFSYPIAIPTSVMALPLRENLLLKAREAVLASMGANSRKSGGTVAIMAANLKLFEPGGSYDILMPPPPTSIKATHILALMRTTYLQLAKTTINYDKAHPNESSKGMWELERRDRIEKIENVAAYHALHHDILRLSFEQLHKQFPDQNDWLDELHTDFTAWVNRSLTDNKLWMDKAGGFEAAVIAADLQFPDYKVPMANLTAYEPTDQFRALLAFCEALPENEKQRFLLEPERLWPMSSGGHAFCLKPSLLLQQMAAGKNAESILKELTSTTVRMADISHEKRRELLEKALFEIPATMRNPIRNQLSKLDMSKMTIEEFGQKILGQLYLLPIDTKSRAAIRKRIENQFFSYLPQDMPIYLVGDLNYSDRHFNNQYLALARSPLDGSLKWVNCLRNGSRQLLHFKLDKIRCMQPISRIENGRLTFI
ncbi:MAG: hypothetical protein LLG04_17180 [Parachlamydia sp.]|nr:hypothetical protein [Parachlamydia sp.]